MIIFDDMCFTHWPRESVIHLLDIEEETQINVKHGMVVIPAGTIRIITTNLERENLFPPDAAGSIDRRILFVRIQSEMFD